MGLHPFLWPVVLFDVDCPALADALVSSHGQAERIYGALHEVGQVHVFDNGLEEQLLLALAQLIMARFIGHAEPLVLMDKIVVFIQLRAVNEQGVGIGVCIHVVR